VIAVDRLALTVTLIMSYANFIFRDKFYFNAHKTDKTMLIWTWHARHAKCSTVTQNIIKLYWTFDAYLVRNRRGYFWRTL